VHVYPCVNEKILYWYTACRSFVGIKTSMRTRKINTQLSITTPLTKSSQNKIHNQPTMAGIVVCCGGLIGMVGGTALYLGLHFGNVPETTQLIVEGVLLGMALIVVCCVNWQYWFPQRRSDNNPPTTGGPSNFAGGALWCFLVMTGVVSLLLTVVGWCTWSTRCDPGEE
jgi:hypothetical protein